MKKTSTLRLVLAGLFTAMGVGLPIAFHALSLSGTIFLPMHIPVLLCGIVCGWKYGMITGIIVPIISSFLTGMPPLYPVGAAMALELAAYGTFIGILSRRMNIIAALLGAMLGGRVVLGISNVVLMGLAGKSYTFSAFISGAFVTAFPGIILQLVLIPSIYLILEKNKLLDKAV